MNTPKRSNAISFTWPQAEADLAASCTWSVVLCSLDHLLTPAYWCSKPGGSRCGMRCSAIITGKACEGYQEFRKGA